MKKTLLKLVSSGILLSAISTGLTAAPIQTTYSNFKDQLTIHFSGFPLADVYTAFYQDNNDVNISGPNVGLMADDPTVIISSPNKMENGAPSMKLISDGYGYISNCTMTFYDGPYLPRLMYQSDELPVCTNLNFSPIQKEGQNQYSMTITYVA